ncbi:hypothetical protein LNKW23_08660 [Paralimibaculum aggregatum]|uniref:Methyltransferase domain-containing protein n=1 Tax=Paralimibaculum aggregatum TaxID=3036245 RepID=A0ABQ6LLG2_9RHOB|nr:class I SAM-dependent methyltransferase [Limibaculum sp. NKW23]GMG81653.1 hypothetical protein LNKW23_08660 [Limibaculum sp. NKW23]
MLTRDAVIDAYRLLLGRAPESEAAIAHHQALGTPERLAETILRSEEFARRFRALTGARAASPIAEVLPPMGSIALTEDPEALAAMLAETAETWRRLGEARPHHSVMGHPDYLPERVAADAAGAEAAFAATGEDELALLDAALARFPEPERLTAGLCLEIGCGICRMTLPLAARFARVLGIDVSPSHLEIAGAVLARAGAGNVALRRLTGLADYAALPEAQFVYSRYVLHHNAPPVQRAMLRAMLGRLAPGGGAMVQTVTSIEGYAFDTARHLAEGGRVQETHALPQRAIFALIAELGLRLVEVQRDDTAADQPWLRSFVFLVEAPG